MSFPLQSLSCGPGTRMHTTRQQLQHQQQEQEEEWRLLSQHLQLHPHRGKEPGAQLDGRGGSALVSQPGVLKVG
jgi:hypothetical protein